MHIKILLQQWNKNYFKKIHHQLFKNQSVELSLSSEINNIFLEGEVIFMKNFTVGLPVVSKLIDLAISKRQRDKRKQVFLRKKILHERENGFTMNTQKYHTTWWFVLWSNLLINFTKYFFISQNVSHAMQKKNYSWRQQKNNEYS